MFENYLIEHCSPTLASLKTANMFSVRYEHLSAVRDAIDMYNGFFSEKEVRLLLLKAEKGLALIYVYRRSRLQADLNAPGAAEFLREYGYASADADYCIARLKKRLASCEDFPHEIGVFLGYPLSDVIGFIENAGQNCKCVGCWKVYGNECEAVKTFAKYKKCAAVYSRLAAQGRTALQMTV